MTYIHDKYNIHESVNIDPTVKIDCDYFAAGEGTIIRAHAEIYGDHVVLGRESFIDEYAVIGGGSAGNLVAGDWFHLGMFAQINTACDVTIGNEVGVGINSKVFTHGAYLSELDGFPVEFSPVSIGNRVWLPNAIVMPGVNIGSDVVVGAGALVTRDIPSHSLAVGSPAKVIASNWPAPITKNRQNEIIERIVERADVLVTQEGHYLYCDYATFDLEDKTVTGTPTPRSERFRNQLRRHGIRFPVWAKDTYTPW